MKPTPQSPQASIGLMVCLLALIACASLFQDAVLPLAQADDAASQTAPTTTDQATVKPEITNKAETTFTPGITLRLTCQTDGIGVRHAPPKKTTGKVGLELKIADDDTKRGQWKITSVDTHHKESFAAYLNSEKMCDSGCPLRLNEKIGAELWAPKPLSFDKLGKNDLLVIITIDETTLKLKSSTFQGVDDGSAPLVFEKGTCEKI